MTLDELEKRVRILEDREEIMNLQKQYMYWLDSYEFNKIVDSFTEDAVVEIRNEAPRRGEKEITDLYKNRHKGPGYEAHFVGQPLITLNGDRATGYWNVCILFSEPVRWVQGRNECEYIKENGKWKFSKLKFRRTKAAPPSMVP